MDRSRSPFSTRDGEISTTSNIYGIPNLDNDQENNRRRAFTSPINDFDAKQRVEEIRKNRIASTNQALSFISRFYNIKSSSENEIMLTRNSFMNHNIMLFEDYKSKMNNNMLQDNNPMNSNRLDIENNFLLGHIRYIHKTIRREDIAIKDINFQELTDDVNLRGIRSLIMHAYENQSQAMINHLQPNMLNPLSYEQIQQQQQNFLNKMQLQYQLPVQNQQQRLQSPANDPLLNYSSRLNPTYNQPSNGIQNEILNKQGLVKSMNNSANISMNNSNTQSPFPNTQPGLISENGISYEQALAQYESYIKASQTSKLPTQQEGMTISMMMTPSQDDNNNHSSRKGLINENTNLIISPRTQENMTTNNNTNRSRIANEEQKSIVTASTINTYPMMMNSNTLISSNNNDGSEKPLNIKIDLSKFKKNNPSKINDTNTLSTSTPQHLSQLYPQQQQQGQGQLYLQQQQGQGQLYLQQQQSQLYPQQQLIQQQQPLQNMAYPANKAMLNDLLLANSSSSGMNSPQIKYFASNTSGDTSNIEDLSLINSVKEDINKLSSKMLENLQGNMQNNLVDSTSNSRPTPTKAKEDVQPNLSTSITKSEAVKDNNNSNNIHQPKQFSSNHSQALKYARDKKLTLGKDHSISPVRANLDLTTSGGSQTLKKRSVTPTNRDNKFSHYGSSNNGVGVNRAGGGMNTSKSPKSTNTTSSTFKYTTTTNNKTANTTNHTTTQQTYYYTLQSNVMNRKQTHPTSTKNIQRKTFDLQSPNQKSFMKRVQKDDRIAIMEVLLLKMNDLKYYHQIGLRIFYQILKLHRARLPSDIRKLGDAYVKEEFRLNRQKASLDQYKQFLDSWIDYYKELAQQVDLKDLGKDLTEDQKNLLNKEQQDTLIKLKEYVKK